MFVNARSGAKNDKVKFTLDKQWILARLKYGHCELTGIAFDFEIGGRIGRFNPYSPSIDRRTAGGDYSPENCRIILTALNVGINYWGEDIYRHIAKQYLNQRNEALDDEYSRNVIVNSKYQESVSIRNH
jgi:hypothetical protein